MARSMLAAGLLLAALLSVPAASAGHDDPNCFRTIFEDPSPEHYVCAVTDGLGTALEPFLDAALCLAAADPVTVNVQYVAGCL